MITIKEQPWAAIPLLRFLVGEKRARAEQIAVFQGATNQVIGHHESKFVRVTVWHVLGFGRTQAEALAMARQTVGADFFCADRLGCVPRFDPGNQVAA